MKKPDGGYGNALMRKSDPKRKESEETSSQPLKIKRFRKPPIIGQHVSFFEDSDEEKAPPKGPTIASISTKIVTLRENVRDLRGSLAESRVDIRDLEDDINTCRLGIGTKINRLARAAGVVG